MSNPKHLYLNESLRFNTLCHRDILLINPLIFDIQGGHTAPCSSTPGPNTLTLEVSTAGSTVTLAGKPGTGLPPYFSSRVYMPDVRGT